jgi:hypothetical protein
VQGKKGEWIEGKFVSSVAERYGPLPGLRARGGGKGVVGVKKLN